MPGLALTEWGPAAWNTLHAFAHAAPEEFDDDVRAEWRRFLRTFAHFLPCTRCRTHFVDFLDRELEGGLRGRASLVAMLNDAHNEVNLRTGKRAYTLDEHYRVYAPPQPVVLTPALGAALTTLGVLAVALVVAAARRRMRGEKFTRP